MAEKERRSWIDNASYEQLLRKWRFAPAGSPFFRGKLGDYFAKVMAEKREEIGSNEATRISKKLGWTA